MKSAMYDRKHDVKNEEQTRAMAFFFFLNKHQTVKYYSYTEILKYYFICTLYSSIQLANCYCEKYNVKYIHKSSDKLVLLLLLLYPIV